MFDVPAKFEATLAQSHILTVDTFIDCLVVANFPELTAIAIIAILLAYLLIDLLLFQHVFLLLDFPDNIRSLLVPAKRALHHIIVLHLVLDPLTETLQVKCVVTDRMAGGSRITFHDLHVTDCTEVVLVLILLLHDDVPPQDLDLCVLQKLFNFVVVYAPVRDDVPEFLVVVFVPEK